MECVSQAPHQNHQINIKLLRLSSVFIFIVSKSALKYENNNLLYLKDNNRGI